MLKTDFKDLIPVGGEKLYQITDSSTGAIIGNSVRIRRANGNVQNGDKYGAAEVNEERELINQLSNPNILINADFKVWQRGEAFTDKTKLINKYSADRWRVNHTGLTASLVIVKNFLYGGMSINKSNTTGDAEICQFVENADMYLNKDLTLSFNGTSGSTEYKNETTFKLNVSQTSHVITNNDYYFGATYVPADNVIVVKFGIKRVSSIVLKYIKLEFGKKATPHISRPYAEELAMCHRYYQSYTSGWMFLCAVNTATVNGFTFFTEMRVVPTIRSQKTLKNDGVTDIIAELYDITKFGLKRIVFSLDANLTNSFIYFQADFDAEIY